VTLRASPDPPATVAANVTVLLMRLSYDASDRDRRLVRTVPAAQIQTPDRRFRVFIPSMLGEPADERQAARLAVLGNVTFVCFPWRPSRCSDRVLDSSAEPQVILKPFGGLAGRWLGRACNWGQDQDRKLRAQ
jgi:hypothetical protein